MRMTDFMSNCWLLPSTRSAAHSSQTRQKRERERCGIQTSSGQNYIYIFHTNHQCILQQSSSLFLCFGTSIYANMSPPWPLQKKAEASKAISSFEPSQYLALSGSSGLRMAICLQGKGFWLEWMLGFGRGHFLASILPSRIEIGTWPPKFVNDTSPYSRHPTLPLVAMTTWNKTESYETHLNIACHLGHSVATVTPDPLLVSFAITSLSPGN